MKFRPEEVERIVGKLLDEWKAAKLVSWTLPEAKVKVRLIEVFLAELRVEDDLHREVEQMLAKYEKDFQSGKLDRRKMFQMVKKQLAKDRGIVL